MNRILLCVDGSPASRAATRWVAPTPPPLRSQVIVATVIETTAEHRFPSSVGYERCRTELGDECLPIDAAGVAVETKVLCGDRAGALLELADTADVTMIVVGRRSGPEPDGEHTGALVTAIARHARHPVAVIPASARRRATKHIVVGVDGSRTSAGALGVAASLAYPLGAHVLAVHAFRPPFGWVRDGGHSDWHARCQEWLETVWTAPLREAGLVSYSTLLVADNHVADTLRSVAAQHDSDLLVAGTRDLGRPDNGFLGTVALELLRNLERPLLLVPHRS